MLIGHGIDLINRQKAEIERLHEDKTELLKAKGFIVYSELEIVKKAKSEARKEFAERLRKTMTATSKTTSGYCKYIVVDDEIDNLLEEMEEKQ